jgi:peptidoglycan hydrolase-like protein with peptidoglycan-binding domain
VSDLEDFMTGPNARKKPLFMQSAETAAPPRANFASEMDPFERAAYRTRRPYAEAAGPMPGPPHIHSPAEMAEAATMFAPLPIRFAAAAPRLATGALAGYNLLSSTNETNAEEPSATRQLQMQLQQAGHYKGVVDGRMGPETRQAQEAYAAAQEQERAQARQLEQDKISASLGAANATRASAEAAAAETKRLADAAALKSQQRDQGNQRLQDMEANTPGYRKAIRDYSTPLGVAAGLVAGAAARKGVVAASDKLSEMGANKAEQLFATATKSTPARVARVNEFWRKGGGEVPFLPTPGANPGFAANPNVSGMDKLYQPSRGANAATDLGVAGAFGAESAAAQRFMEDPAREELRAANEATAADPSEANIQRLQAAKDNMAIAGGLKSFGRLGGLGYLGSSVKMQRSSAVPNMVPAEAERMALEKTLRLRAARNAKAPAEIPARPSRE